MMHFMWFVVLPCIVILSNCLFRLGKKVSRVFSMNRTPNRMKRAISSVTSLVSPMRRESSIFGLAPSTPGRRDVESFGAARFDDASVSVCTHIRFGFNTEGWISTEPSLVNCIW